MGPRRQSAPASRAGTANEGQATARVKTILANRSFASTVDVTPSRAMTARHTPGEVDPSLTDSSRASTTKVAD